MDQILAYFGAVTALEWTAVGLTAWCIWLAGQNKILTWPVGIAAVLCYAKLFYDAKLYADTLLQFFFVATSVYGWVFWSKKAGSEVEPIRSSTWVYNLAILFTGVCTTYMYSMMLVTVTDSPAPKLDSMVLVFSIVGQLLLMRRYIENWPVWIMVNTVSVPLYFSRELYLTAIMYAVFWVHAWYAWWKWYKEME